MVSWWMQYTLGNVKVFHTPTRLHHLPNMWWQRWHGSETCKILGPGSTGCWMEQGECRTMLHFQTFQALGTELRCHTQIWGILKKPHKSTFQASLWPMTSVLVIMDIYSFARMMWTCCVHAHARWAYYTCSLIFLSIPTIQFSLSYNYVVTHTPSLYSLALCSFWFLAVVNVLRGNCWQKHLC